MQNHQKIKNYDYKTLVEEQEESKNNEVSGAYTSNLITSSSISTVRDNVVEGAVLRNIQTKTLSRIADILAKTFGPMGSNSKILNGNDANTIFSEYTKDGHNVLKHILFNNPIEMSIQAELVDITHHVEHEVGDGTTSAVVLSSKIFKNFLKVMEKHPDIPPYRLIRAFDSVVEVISEDIKNKAQEVTLKDIYDICMISTNGNTEVSKNISDLYAEYGVDVDIQISLSSTNETMTKTYEGLTITEGYADPAYINNKTKGTSEIHNARVYAFFDPVDTTDMVSLFEKIIFTNIIEKLNDEEQPIPTVIICPKMSRDMSSLMEQFLTLMYQTEDSQKPPLLVITDISGSDEGIFLDIAKLCGCKYIKKYIDPEIKKMDEEKGLAATLDTVVDFYGECELVVSDVGKTKFINPKDMFTEDGDYSDNYKALVNFLEAELENARANGEDDRSVGFMRKRLRSLKSNTVDYMIGGISVADRDSLKDSIEDAVKNCASAVANGYCRAANIEGLDSAATVYYIYSKDTDGDPLFIDMTRAIFFAYSDTVRLLYSTAEPDINKVDDIIAECLRTGKVYDIRSGEISDKVITSAMTDIKILEAISKIVTIMVTSNQCLLQAPQLNTYM